MPRALPAAAVEGKHRLRLQSFPQWVLARECADLGHDRVVAAERQLRLQPLLQCDQP